MARTMPHTHREANAIRKVAQQISNIGNHPAFGKKHAMNDTRNTIQSPQDTMTGAKEPQQQSLFDRITYQADRACQAAHRTDALATILEEKLAKLHGIAQPSYDATTNGNDAIPSTLDQMRHHDIWQQQSMDRIEKAISML